MRSMTYSTATYQNKVLNNEVLFLALLEDDLQLCRLGLKPFHVLFTPSSESLLSALILLGSRKLLIAAIISSASSM